MLAVPARGSSHSPNPENRDLHRRAGCRRPNRRIRPCTTVRSAILEPQPKPTPWWGALAGLLVGFLANAADPAESIPRPAPDAVGSDAVAKATDTVPSQARAASMQRETLVALGNDAVLPAGQQAEVVVAILGNARIDGHVRDTVVVVWGDAEISGSVDGDVVAVLGTVRLQPSAEVRGDVVGIGRGIILEPGAKVRGDAQEIRLGGWNRSGLTTWVQECVLKLRPLSLRVGWVWIGLAAFYGFYLLLLMLFPRAVRACAEVVDTRPATTLILGVLIKMLIPLVAFLLLLTGVGLLVLPFVILAAFLAGLLGKVGLLVYLGRRLLRSVGWDRDMLPLAFLLGAFIVTGLYLVPIVGMFTVVLTGFWALGAAALALWNGIQEETAPRSGAARSTVPAAGGASCSPASSDAAPATASGLTSWPTDLPELPSSASAGPGQGPPHTGVGSVPAAMPAPSTLAPGEAWTLPRAGFWERMGAGLLDLVVVSLLMALVGGLPWGWVVALIYFVGMWTWRSTTLGGVILRLKVVRLDGQPLRLDVALVRALGAVVSLVVLFLGFLWIAWDRDRQAWHDKLAGTVVVRLPQSPSLVCL